MPALLAAGLMVAALFSATPSGAQPAPKDADGFRNNYPHAGHASFMAWQWERLRHGTPQPPPGGWLFPTVKTDAALLRSRQANPSVTWIGHATMLVQLAGHNLLFDPVFAPRASPLGFVGPKRVVPLPITIEELPRIDLVMVSHNHYDHLDADAVQRLAAQPQGSPRFLVPMGLKAWFNDLGITRVDEYDWWQSTVASGAALTPNLAVAGGASAVNGPGAGVGDLRITFVPVQHWSRRRFDDANQSLWGGWVVDGGGLRLIHTGDTGYSKDFRDIGARLGPFDMAFIPIGAYAPRWFMQVMHVDVPEAVQIRADLRAERAIGMHWGTFESLTDEPLDEPPQLLARQRQARGLSVEQFDVLAIGQTRRLERVVKP